MIYWNAALEKIVNAKHIAVYGAGVMGQTVKKCLEDAPYNIVIESFIVSSLLGNPEYIEGVPVVDINHAQIYRDTTVVVALHERYMSEALNQLEERGFCRLVPLSFDSDEWSDIRANWLQSAKYMMENDITLNEALSGDLHVYVTHNVADHLLEREISNRSFEISIQAGAELTKKRIAPVLDNQGDNISEKNKKFCELTVLYWMWRNDHSAKYLGLSHYRRRFDINEHMATRLTESDIDVVLTVPVVNIQGVKYQYCADHVEKDWEIMREAVGELFPQYRETVESVQKSYYYYAYNMLIARREVLDQYCKWLFPILFYCENKIGERQDIYQGRYIGFLAERLMTVFFEHHRREYKRAIAKKHFLGSDT